ncbi:MAG: zinc-dependent metalloprotease [Pseudomonadota bacterium]
MNSKVKRSLAACAAAAAAAASASAADPARCERVAAGLPSIEQYAEAEGLTRAEGLFPSYVDALGGSVWLEVRADQLDDDVILVSQVERGIAGLGTGLVGGALKQNALVRFSCAGLALDLVRSSARYAFDADPDLARAQGGNISDSRIAAAPIFAASTGPQGVRYLVGVDATLGELEDADLRRTLRRAGLSYNVEEVRLAATRNYPKNTDLSVDYVLSFENGPGALSAPGAVSGENFAYRLRHSFVARPAAGYAPRRADPRVGFFSTAREDLTALDPAPQDLILRWRLEKKQPEAPLSEPVEPITFWIEKTTPARYRPAIADAVLAWNEAFEAAGFKDAVAVQVQPDDAEWEAGDIRRNVIRWAPEPGIGPLGFAQFAFDPQTGEIVGADVVIAFNSLRRDRRSEDFLVERGEAADPLVAVREALDAAAARPRRAGPSGIVHSDGAFGAALAFAEKLKETRAEDDAKRDDRPGADKIRAAGAAPDGQRPIAVSAQTGAAPAPSQSPPLSRLRYEAVAHLVLHEVGHALGLTHNFRASRWRTPAEVADPTVTQGVVAASVMDYTTANIAPPGAPQGDYYSVRPGPYDVWAVTFGYADHGGGESDTGEESVERNAVLALSTKPEHAYGADLDNDPRNLRFDFTSDPIASAKTQFALADELAGRLADPERVRPWADYLDGYRALATQRGLNVRLLTQLVRPFQLDALSPEQAAEDARGQARPTPRADLEAALEALSEMVFEKPSLALSPELFTRISTPRRTAFDAPGAYNGIRPINAGSEALSLRAAPIDALVNVRVLRDFENAVAYGGGFGADDLLSVLIEAVYGEDLGPLGSPSVERRFQQRRFAERLVAVPAGDPLVGEAATAARRALRRRLAASYPWSSAETRAHRDALRAILDGFGGLGLSVPR